MPYWLRKLKVFNRMDFIIKHSPGIRPAEVARKLGVYRSTIIRRLPSMEEAGYLYSEDDYGVYGHIGALNEACERLLRNSTTIFVTLFTISKTYLSVLRGYI